jgi:hypothetical protein
MKQTLQLINDLQSRGTIGKYAIGGAVGATFYLGPIPTKILRPAVTKSEWRERQRKLTFAEKVAVLEKLRRRDALIAQAGLRRQPQ